MDKTINASIVTYHTEESELSHCLDLLSSSSSVDRIFIIDNASEESIRQIALRYPKVTYTAERNVGYGRAHNLAMRQTLASDTPLHLVLNTDIDFSPADLDKMANIMLENKDIGALQPEITNTDGTSQYTVRLLPTPLDLFLRRFMPKWFMHRRRERYELRHADRSRPFNVAYHQGSFMLLRADTLRHTGLFDERFFMYPEDIDLTRRIHSISRTFYYPAISVVHNHRRDSYKSWRMTWLHILNMIKYFNKWGWFHDPERRRINHRVLLESAPEES